MGKPFLKAPYLEDFALPSYLGCWKSLPNQPAKMEEQHISKAWVGAILGRFHKFNHSPKLVK